MIATYYDPIAIQYTFVDAALAVLIKATVVFAPITAA
jgi:hypothetical protein